MNLLKKKTSSNILHYPRLDTVLMIEDAIKEHEDYPTKMQLWKSLPKQVQYQTFNLVLDYLEHGGKIMFHEGKIIWTWNPKLLEMIKKQNLIIK